MSCLNSLEGGNSFDKLREKLINLKLPYLNPPGGRQRF